MRAPPFVSLILFAAVAAVFVWGWRTGHMQPAPAPAPSTSEPIDKAGDARRRRIAQLALDWPDSPAFDPPFNALDPTFEAASATGSLFDPADDYWGLPRTEGYNLVYGYCSACHSLRIVMQQHATPQRWDELLDWMTEKQGMPPLPPDDRAAVLAYLSRYFSATSSP